MILFLTPKMPFVVLLRKTCFPFKDADQPHIGCEVSLWYTVSTGSSLGAAVVVEVAGAAVDDAEEKSGKLIRP